MRLATFGCAFALLGALFLGGCAGKNADKSGNSNASKSGSGKTAEDPFDMASEDPPLTANTHFAAGQLAESQNQMDKAIVQYREALKIDPKNRNTLFALGALLTRMRRPAEAVPVWEQYIVVTNHAPAAYNNLALCYETAGQVAKAEETYKTCIAKMPQDMTIRVNYGLMLARQNRLDDASAQLSTALKPAEVSYNLGRVFQEGGKIEQAKAYYQQALQQDPTLRDAKAQLEKLK